MKKVTFERIVIQNFLSIGEEPVIIDFRSGISVITGRNKDKIDRKNALGKSSVADSLYFSIFGETLREIKKELITNNITGGKTQVELYFSVESSEGINKYHIVRTLSPTKVSVYKDGVDKTRDSVGNTTKYICDIIGASPAVFQNCVIMTVNNAIPFMAKNKIEKRKFIEDIFGMEVFSKMISALRAEYNEVKKEYDIQNSKCEEVQKSLREFTIQKNKSLDKRQEKKELYLERQKNNDAEINTLRAKLESISDNDILDIKLSISQYEHKLVECDGVINQLIENSTSKKTTLTHKKEEYRKINTGESVCPSCLRAIEEHDKCNIAAEKAKLKSEIEDLVGTIRELLIEIQETKDNKLHIKNSIQELNTVLGEANLKLQSKTNIEERIEQLQKWQIELNHDIEALNSTSTEFDSMISTTEGRLKELQKEVSKISKHISKLDIVKFVVSEEGVKSYIVNKLLEMLNTKLYYYLKKLDSNSVCVFNEYFEEEIVNDKGKICSYFNFSGAERKAIDLACLFAFSDMRRLQGGISYSVAMYDELFDSSFDDKGIELITEILKERTEALDECNIIISHRSSSLKAVTADVIFLEKQNGITKRVAFVDE